MLLARIKRVLQCEGGGRTGVGGGSGGCIVGEGAVEMMMRTTTIK